MTKVDQVSSVVVEDARVGRCPGRSHPNHVIDVCNGSCCTACGGPIDESEACRCDFIAPRKSP